MARERGTGIYTKTRFGGGHEVITYGGSVYLMSASKRNQLLLRAENRELTHIDSQHHFSLKTNYSERLAMTHDLLRLQDDLRRVKYLDGDIRGKPKNQWDNRLQHRPAARRNDSKSGRNQQLGKNSLPDIRGASNRRVQFKIAAEHSNMGAKDDRLTGLQLAAETEELRMPALESNIQHLDLKETLESEENEGRYGLKSNEQIDSTKGIEIQNQLLDLDMANESDNKNKPIADFPMAAKNESHQTGTKTLTAEDNGNNQLDMVSRHGERWERFKTTGSKNNWWEELKTIVQSDTQFSGSKNNQEQTADQELTIKNNNQPIQHKPKDFLPFIEMHRAHSLINIRKSHRSREESINYSSSARKAPTQHGKDSAMTALSERLSLRGWRKGQQSLTHIGVSKQNSYVIP